LSVLRMIRIARSVRLLRFFKIEALLRDQLKRINSTVGLNCIRLIMMLFALFTLTHLLACVWHWIGQSTEGWQEFYVRPDQGAGTAYGYVTALHWAVTQFHGSTDIHPTNLTERVFAVVVLVHGMMIFSTFVGVTTDMMLQVRLAFKQKTRLREKMQEYFLRHNVSTEVTILVKRYMENNIEQEGWEEDSKVLQFLPLTLQRSVLLEVRAPTVAGHPLFAWLSDENAPALRDICQTAMSTVRVYGEQAVFNQGDVCRQMYFVEAGELRYFASEATDNPGGGGGRGSCHRRASIGRDLIFRRRGKLLTRQQWISEPALWLQNWRNVGDFIACVRGTLITVESIGLTKAAAAFPSVHCHLAFYAHSAVRHMRFLAFQDLESKITDLWEPELVPFVPDFDDPIFTSDVVLASRKSTRSASPMAQSSDFFLSQDSDDGLDVKDNLHARVSRYSVSM